MSVLAQYEQYTAEQGLPLQRIELMLARIALQLDRLARPGATLTLQDYLLPTGPRPPAASPGAARAAPQPTPEAVAAEMRRIGFRSRRRPPPEPDPAQPATQPATPPAP